MGRVFAHVADQALAQCDGARCHHCGRSGRPIYAYPGTIVDPACAGDPELARDEPEISEACSACILGGNLRRSDRARAHALIAAWPEHASRLWREYDQLPNVPLFLQGLDWPICCGQWCEFVGHPASAGALAELATVSGYWERGPAAGRGRDFASQGPPESLREISMFGCHACGSHWHVDQFT